MNLTSIIVWFIIISLVRSLFAGFKKIKANQPGRKPSSEEGEVQKRPGGGVLQEIITEIGREIEKEKKKTEPFHKEFLEKAPVEAVAPKQEIVTPKKREKPLPKERRDPFATTSLKTKEMGKAPCGEKEVLPLNRGSLRQAIIWQEILSPPLSIRE